MKLSKLKLLIAGATLSIATTSGAYAAECIAPANPGGGWDFTCRQVGKVMFDIGVVDSPVQVTNMAGAGGGLAYANVVNERNDDDQLIVAASTATATRLAQNAYSGMTSDQVRFLGAIGADPGVIVVGADSPYHTLNELLDAVIANPEQHSFAGGSAAGGYDHLKVLMALKRKGFTDIRKVKYIAVDGDADAITQTVGGFTSAMTGDISGVVSFIKSGQVRILASFTDERIQIPGLDVEIPTAKEQGVDVVAVNWRGLYTPKGASEASYQKWSQALAKVAESDEWKDAMVANGLVKFTKVGPEFQAYLDGVMQEVQDMSKELGVIR